MVSDTHGYLDPRLIEALGGVDAILHAGDVGGASVLEALSALATLYAVEGNNDAGLGLGLPERLDLRFDGVSIHLVHELARAAPSAGTSVVVFGHSHRQLAEWREGVLYLNPGAAGRRGFHALQTAALLRVEDGTASAELLVLGPRLKPARRV